MVLNALKILPNQSKYVLLMLTINSVAYKCVCCSENSFQELNSRARKHVSKYKLLENSWMPIKKHTIRNLFTSIGYTFVVSIKTLVGEGDLLRMVM